MEWDGKKRKIPFGKGWDEEEISLWNGMKRKIPSGISLWNGKKRKTLCGISLWNKMKRKFPLWNGMEFPNPSGWKIQDFQVSHRTQNSRGSEWILAPLEYSLRLGGDPWETFWDPWIDPRFPNSLGYSAGKDFSWYSEGITSTENLDGRIRNTRTT